MIGPGIQNQFNDQSSQYRNYNTYDLFVPEYGDTVPALIMGGAGMTYEKGTNENYGKQVYDHYLAMDTTVNVVAAHKTSLMTDWVKQWKEAVDQGASCTVQANSQVSPPLIDQFEVGQSTIDQDPNVKVCGYYYLPNAHSGDVASTLKELQSVGVRAYKLGSAVSVPGVHRFGNFNINAVAGGPSPALTETKTLPAGTLYIPMTQGNKHWIQAVLDENPFLPFNYFYDEVTWSYSLLRGFAGDGFLTQPLPAGTPMTLVFDPNQTHGARCGSGRVRVQHRLDDRPRDGQPAARPGCERRPRRHGVRRRRRALLLRCGARRRDVGQPGDAERRRGAVGHAGLRARLVPGQPLRADAAEDRRLHRRDDRADEPGLPRHGRRPVQARPRTARRCST